MCCPPSKLGKSNVKASIPVVDWYATNPLIDEIAKSDLLDDADLQSLVVPPPPIWESYMH